MAIRPQWIWGQCCRSVIDARNPNGRNPDFAGSFSFGGYPAGAVATRRPFERATMMSAAPEASSRNDRYFLVLGAAALDLWGHLPQALQESLFERAVVLGHKSERDESLREQLAKFLHDHHPRTLG
jgi:hypothetical protein